MLRSGTLRFSIRTESVITGRRRDLCSPVLQGSRCSCRSISEVSGSGGTSGTMSSWSGTPWRSQSDPSGHRSTPAATSADITCSCPHTTDSPVSVRNVFRNLGHCRTSLSCAWNLHLQQSSTEPTCRYPSGSMATQSATDSGSSERSNSPHQATVPIEGSSETMSVSCLMRVLYRLSFTTSVPYAVSISRSTRYT